MLAPSSSSRSHSSQPTRRCWERLSACLTPSTNRAKSHPSLEVHSKHLWAFYSTELTNSVIGLSGCSRAIFSVLTVTVITSATSLGSSLCASCCTLLHACKGQTHSCTLMAIIFFGVDATCQVLTAQKCGVKDNS